MNLMFLIINKALIVFLFCVLSINSNAYDQNKQFKSMGVGEIPCGQYLFSRHEIKRGGKTDIRFYHWVTGYITAYNQQTPGQFDFIGDRNLATFMRQLDSVCKKNPNHSIVRAVQEVMVKLR